MLRSEMFQWMADNQQRRLSRVLRSIKDLTLTPLTLTLIQGSRMRDMRTCRGRLDLITMTWGWCRTQWSHSWRIILIQSGRIHILSVLLSALETSFWWCKAIDLMYTRATGVGTLTKWRLVRRWRVEELDLQRGMSLRWLNRIIHHGNLTHTFIGVLRRRVEGLLITS